MIEITIANGENEQKFPIPETPFVLGRSPNPTCPEIFLPDPFVSRRHLELNEVGDGQLTVRCLGSSPIELSTGETIERNCEATVPLPVEIRIGRSGIRATQVSLGLSFLSTPTANVSAAEQNKHAFDVSHFVSAKSVAPDRLIRWFENLVALQGSAGGGKSLFRQAAQAVVELVGLDRCVVLTRDGDQWRVDGEHGEQGASENTFSQSVVRLVRSSKQTVYECSGVLTGTNSLAGVSAFVGSPITNANGDVVGCLFGVRRLEAMSTSTGVLPVEAQLVQVIAGIVSARVSRLAAEAEQVRSQIQLEQFASAALVREMQSNPQWLDATERELTLMFGDIRSFSGITQRLTAHQTFAFVRDVMDCMTAVIHQYGGFVFNFAGDGIAAMWNAPEPTSNHADQACRAAIEIQRRLPSELECWLPLVGGRVDVGLGIHTGDALIGNSGSKERLKYSPLGHAVNLASRVEGATKYLGVSTLITQSTRDQLTGALCTRDLGEISVIGIDHCVRVHELADPSEIDQIRWNAYQQARQLFETGDSVSAANTVKRILSEHPDDTPTKILGEQIEGSAETREPWRLPNK